MDNATPADSMTELIEGPTPRGGVAVQVYYLNDKRELVPKSQATRAEIVELDDKGEHICRHYVEFDNAEEPNYNKD